MLVLLYLIAYLDKTNIGMAYYSMPDVNGKADLTLGNAKIEGLTVDLGLKGIQYNVVVAIFFIPFVLFGNKALTSKQYCVANLIGRGPVQHDPP